MDCKGLFRLLNCHLIAVTLFLISSTRNIYGQNDDFTSKKYNYEFGIGYSIGANSQEREFNFYKPIYTRSDGKIDLRNFIPGDSDFSYKFGIWDDRSKIQAGLFYYIVGHGTYFGLDLSYFPVYRYSSKKRLNLNPMAIYALDVGFSKGYVTFHRFGLGGELDIKLWRGLYWKYNASLNYLTQNSHPHLVIQTFLTYKF